MRSAVREGALSEECVHEHAHIGLCERLEHEELGVLPQRRPGRSCLEQLGSRTGEEQDLPLPAEAGHVLDEIEEPRLGPMQILEDDD